MNVSKEKVQTHLAVYNELSEVIRKSAICFHVACHHIMCSQQKKHNGRSCKGVEWNVCWFPNQQAVPGLAVGLFS